MHFFFENWFSETRPFSTGSSTATPASPESTAPTTTYTLDYLTTNDYRATTMYTLCRVQTINLNYSSVRMPSQTT